MSTKTSFKRIALVAVAALGFGLLSVSPSSATNESFGGTITVTTLTTTPTAGSAVNVLVNLKGFCVAGANTEGAYFSSIISGAPTGSSTLSLSSSALVSETATATADATYGVRTYIPAGPSGGAYKTATGAVWIDCGGSSGTFSVYEILTFTPDIAGTYNIYTVDPDHATWLYNTTSITVAAAAEASAAWSTATQAIAGTGTGSSTLGFSAPKKATAADIGTITVVMNNGNTNTLVSYPGLTASVSGPGLVSWDAATFGKNVTNTTKTQTQTLHIQADGQTGVGTITISYTNAAGGTTVLATKTVTFYDSIAKIALTVYHSTIGVGDYYTANPNDPLTAYVVKAVATDATGNPVPAATLYLTSADKSIISNNATTAVTGSTGKAYFSLSGVQAGSTTVKVANGTLSTATGYVTSDASSVITVASTTPKFVTMTWDKSDYLPGEVATLSVKLTDKDKKPVADGAYVVFATGGLTSSYALTQVTDSSGLLTGSAALAATTVYVVGGSADYSINMPVTPGVVKLTGIGEATLDVTQASLYVTSAAATVAADNSVAQAASDAAAEATDAANAATDAANAAAEAADAATAAAQDAADAVAALSTQVTEMVNALKKQITALTNLVIKIQKKVKA